MLLYAEYPFIYHLNLAKSNVITVCHTSLFIGILSSVAGILNLFIYIQGIEYYGSFPQVRGWLCKCQADANYARPLHFQHLGRCTGQFNLIPLGKQFVGTRHHQPGNRIHVIGLQLELEALVNRFNGGVA